MHSTGHSTSECLQGVLLDQYGCLHDGQTPYTGAIEAVRTLAERGLRIVLLSNSSRREQASNQCLVIRTVVVHTNDQSFGMVQAMLMNRQAQRGLWIRLPGWALIGTGSWVSSPQARCAIIRDVDSQPTAMRDVMHSY